MKTRTSSPKLPIVIAICSTLLLICAIGAWVYVHKQQIAQSNKEFQIQQANVKAADLFKKNQDCAKYTSGIKQTMDENNKSSFAIRTETFETIFYSPKDDTCLYTSQTLAGDGSREYFVYNALTTSKVTSFQFPQQYNDYKKFVMDYSGGQVRL